MEASVFHPKSSGLCLLHECYSTITAQVFVSMSMPLPLSWIIKPKLQIHAKHTTVDHTHLTGKALSSNLAMVIKSLHYIVNCLHLNELLHRLYSRLLICTVLCEISMLSRWDHPVAIDAFQNLSWFVW